MNMIQAPEIRVTDSIVPPIINHTILDNQIPVSFVNTTKEAIVRMDLLFKAGSWFQDHPLQASTVCQMLTEGSVQYSAEKIAETIDFYGAMLHCEADKDNAVISLLVLKEHASDFFEFLTEILFNSIFPEKELHNLCRRNKQNFLIEEEKVKTIARKQFYASMFTTEHPYGKMAVEKDFDALDSTLLKQFYQSFFQPSNCKIILSGDIDKNLISSLNKTIGQVKSTLGQIILKDYSLPLYANTKQAISKQGALQTAIRIGCRLFDKKHPDYAGMIVLNTVLGGYFGSRLMKNIREEKGLTYGIGSIVQPLKHSGIFCIISEVDSKRTGEAVAEIYKELEILSKTLISTDELETVKNYLIGDMLRMFDGPFAIADSIRSLEEYDLTSESIVHAFNTIKTIDSSVLKSLANQYLLPEKMTEVIVG
jgi:zinc protease